jgi:hypothetical protein
VSRFWLIAIFGSQSSCKYPATHQSILPVSNPATVANLCQVGCDTSILPTATGFLEVYERRCSHIHWISSHLGHLSLCKGRHLSRSRANPRCALGKCRCRAQQFTCDCFCLHLSSECEMWQSNAFVIRGLTINRCSPL